MIPAHRTRALLAVGLVAGLLSACQGSHGTAPARAPSSSAATSTTGTSTTGPSSTPGAGPATTTTSALAGSGLIATTAFGTQLGPCSFGLRNGALALPDGRCTPGAVDPAVSQATLGQTICTSGYTSTVRPPESVTYPEKRAAMAAYGAAGSTGLYEYDHLVSLELGGAPNAAANLWPEPYAGPYGARVKDRVENALHALVCAGSLSLAQAQRQEATDWVAAYQRYVGPLP